MHLIERLATLAARRQIIHQVAHHGFNFGLARSVVVATNLAGEQEAERNASAGLEQTPHFLSCCEHVCHLIPEKT
jgi:hypothetical protein